jgi:hypothetical protein
MDANELTDKIRRDDDTIKPFLTIDVKPAFSIFGLGPGECVDTAYRDSNGKWRS